MKSLTRSQLGLSKKVIQNNIAKEQPAAVTKKNIISTWDEWRATSEFQAKRQETIRIAREKVLTKKTVESAAEKDALIHQTTREALESFRKEQKALFNAQVSQ